MDFADSVDPETGDPLPIELLGGGEHFDDVDGGRRGAQQRATRAQQRAEVNASLPRAIMPQHAMEQDIHHPQPITK